MIVLRGVSVFSGPLQVFGRGKYPYQKNTYLVCTSVRGFPSITGVTTDSLQDQIFGTSPDS